MDSFGDTIESQRQVSQKTGPVGGNNSHRQRARWQIAKRPLQDIHLAAHSDNCVWSGTWTILNSFALVIVLLVQGSLLNYCIINYNEGSAEWYFLFFADFLILVIFMFSITFAWRFYKRQRRQHQSFAREVMTGVHAAGDQSGNKIGDHHDHSHASEVTQRVGAGIFRFSFPKPMGMLPLIYICWIVYSLNLVVKLFILYVMKIPDKMIIANFSNCKEFLLITLAASVAIFLFWVESHWNLGDSHQRKLSKASVDDLIGHTIFEIFDSLTFLDLITPDDKNEMVRDHERISLLLEMVILFFSSINFMLPTLGLYRLSRTHFGEKTNGMLKVVNETTGQPSTRGLGVSIVYHLLRLFAVNIPFLIIRIIVSQDPQKELSIFIVKNVLGIWVSLRNLIPELKQWMRIREYKKLARIRGDTRLTVKLDAATFDPTKGWELPTLYHNEIEVLNSGRQFSTDSDDNGIMDEEDDGTQATGASSPTSNSSPKGSKNKDTSHPDSHSHSLRGHRF